jgi:hypothetical protein
MSKIKKYIRYAVQINREFRTLNLISQIISQMKKCFSLFLFMLCAAASLSAQRLSGKWEGHLVQEDGGLTHEYGFRLVLTLTDGKVGGYTEVWLPDSKENFSRMNIRGSLRGAMLTFEETEISESEIVPMWEWCLKQGELMMDTSGTEWTLTGSWRGTAITPDCAPGMAELRRPGPVRIVEKPDTVVAETPQEPVLPVVQLNENNLPASIEDRRVTKQRSAISFPSTSTESGLCRISS